MNVSDTEVAWAVLQKAGCVRVDTPEQVASIQGLHRAARSPSVMVKARPSP